MLLLPAGCPAGSHMINEIMWEQKCNDLTFQDFSNKWAQSTLKLIQGGVQWKKPASFEESSSVFFNLTWHLKDYQKWSSTSVLFVDDTWQ